MAYNPGADRHGSAGDPYSGSFDSSGGGSGNMDAAIEQFVLDVANETGRSPSDEELANIVSEIAAYGYINDYWNRHHGETGKYPGVDEQAIRSLLEGHGSGRNHVSGLFEQYNIGSDISTAGGAGTSGRGRAPHVPTAREQAMAALGIDPVQWEKDQLQQEIASRSESEDALLREMGIDPHEFRKQRLAAEIEANSNREDVLLKELGINPHQFHLARLKDEIQAREDAQLKRQYGGIFSVYQGYFGRQPTREEVMEIAGHGVDMQQWTDYIRAKPSHLPGINIGQYTDLRASADNVSQSIYGHDSNDQILTDLYDRGDTSKQTIQFYYDQLPLQPGKNIDPITYNAVYKGAADHTKAIWNQEPHPLDLHAQWVANGSPGQIPNSQAQQNAA